MDTAKEMGARVIRSQTLGDSVGCELCIEPQLGVFNPEAFKAIDYALKAAHDRGIRLIITLAGDCATCDLSGPGEYVEWAHQKDLKAFFTDPAVVAAFENHVAAVLNHKNALTGIAYKDDPTILAWENCNMCGLGVVWTSSSRDLTPYLPWIELSETSSSRLTPALYLNTTGFFRSDKTSLNAKTPDTRHLGIFRALGALLGTGEKTARICLSDDATLITGHGRFTSGMNSDVMSPIGLRHDLENCFAPWKLIRISRMMISGRLQAHRITSGGNRFPPMSAMPPMHAGLERSMVGALLRRHRHDDEHQR